MRKSVLCVSLLLISGCAYHNPLDRADFRFQTLNTPPYVLSSWYRVEQKGDPLTIYIEKEQMDTEQRQAAVNDKTKNVAYLARPCQYFETAVCQQSRNTRQEDEAIQKGIQLLQKKASTETVVVKGL